MSLTKCPLHFFCSHQWHLHMSHVSKLTVKHILIFNLSVLVFPIHPSFQPASQLYKYHMEICVIDLPLLHIHITSVTSFRPACFLIIWHDIIFDVSDDNATVLFAGILVIRFKHVSSQWTLLVMGIGPRCHLLWGAKMEISFDKL